MEILIKGTIRIPVKTLKVCAKTSDCFAASLLDTRGNEVCNYDGYVPNFFPGVHYGDYLMLDIDIETGQITNWQKPSTEAIEEFFSTALRQEER